MVSRFAKVVAQEIAEGIKEIAAKDAT